MTCGVAVVVRGSMLADMVTSYRGVGRAASGLVFHSAEAGDGVLPENVNDAVKSSFLLGFLESVPEGAAMLKEPNTKDRKFEDVVKDAEQAAVLVLVY